ncbi:hypothetical protein [Tenacibaculum sp. 190524A02b]|uniref:hypothetical protein n=1 Tax=Tenacibaculum vairaonense TaxID=3137860 RepID=UPI0031FB7FA0
MKTKIKIAVIAMMGIGLTAKAQWSPNGSNTTKGVLTLDGSYINLNVPVTTGGWARGFNNVATDKSTRLGGIGLFGSKENAAHYYLAHGTSPWSSGLGLYVKTNGNVGIGTTSPSEKLDVNGKAKIDNTLIVDGIDTGNPSAQYEQVRLSGYGLLGNRKAMYVTNENNEGHINFYVGGRHGFGSHLLIQNTGNVGIGTTSPSEKLEVNGNLKVKGISTSQGANNIYSTESGKTHFRLTTNVLDAENAYLYNYNETAKTFHTINIGGSHSLASGLTVLGNGNVGIGTQSPSAGLEVKNNNGIKIQSKEFGGWIGSIKMTDGFSNTTSRDDMLFSTSGGFMFKMDDNGNGISNVQGFNIYDRNNNSVFTIKESNGNVAIKGKLESKEIKVTKTPTADFVFEADYKLPSLETIEKHIKEKKHLPEIASAKEMEKNGVNVGNFQIQLLQKIEELTLYTIDQDKEIKALKKQNAKIEQQQKEINELKALVNRLLKAKN